MATYALFFSVRTSFQKFHSFIDRCVYDHSFCVREIWAKFARWLEKCIRNIEPNAMTLKGQKLRVPHFLLVFLCLCPTISKLLLQWVIENTLVYSAKEKKSQNIIRWRSYFSHTNVTRWRLRNAMMHFYRLSLSYLFSTSAALCQPLTYYVLNISMKGVDIVELHSAS